MSPRVSVVVPTYDNASVITHTLESILSQTWQDFELVIADHGSTDGTFDILEQFAQRDPRIRLETTPRGGGAVRNWNRVTQLATGELVKLVCGDDLLYPHCIAKQVAAYDANAGGERPVNLVASQRDLVDMAGRVFVRGRGLGRLDGRVDGRVALRETVRAGTNLLGEPACVLMRREALVAAGGWPDLRYYLDLGGYAGVLSSGDMVAVREPLAAFRVGGSQWSVELAGSQSADATRFNRFARDLAPGHISQADVRRGDRRARLVAVQRRAAYAVLAVRNRASSR